MIKKTLIVSALALLTIGLSLGQAFAAQQYTVIGSPVAVTATGTLSGSVISMTAVVVTQGTGAGATRVEFVSPAATVVNSGEALKITGGTADVDARIIIYTDNATYFTTGHDPAVEASTGRPTGIDGAGMPGASDAGFVAALIFGITSAADFDPNTNPNYTGFSQANLDAGINCTYITDLRHAYDFVTQALVDGINARLPVTTYTKDQIDNLTLYRTDGTAGPANANDEGTVTFPELAPTLFGESLWSTASPSTRKLIREGLYRNIATVAYSIREPDPNITAEVGNYICQTAKMTTADPTDNVKARLARHGGGATDQYLYVPIGGVFTGKPWQAYTTTKLTVAMVKG